MKLLKKFIKNNPFPLAVVAGYFFLQIILLIMYPLNIREMPVISWDTFGYYLYLPSAFIYHDMFALKFIPGIMQKYALCDSFYQAFIGPTGKYVMSYPIGLAILYSPFFFIGHSIAKISNYPADGFSAPYQYSIFVGGLFYAFIGIVFTIRNLRFFFGQKLSGILLLILLLGTNYFYYTTVENAMSHNYLFTTASILIYLTIKWHQSPRALYAFGIGLLLGLSAIARPTEILWGLIPLLWGLHNRESLKQKMLLIKSNKSHIVLLLTGVLVFGSMQMIYWKISSGRYLYYSYSDNTGFDFLHAQIGNGLFSTRKGWFVYTPVMALAMLGIPLLWVKKRGLFFTISIFISVVIYVTFSWGNWLYGGCFGQRAMIPSYALLLIPMGFFIEAVCNWRTLQWMLSLFVAFCMYLNCLQSWQYASGYLSHEGPWPFSYRLLFLRTHIDRNAIRQFLDLEQPDAPVTDSICLYRTNFETGNWKYRTSEKYFSDSIALKLFFSQSELLFDSSITNKGFNFIRIDAKAMFEPFEWDDKKFARIVTDIKSNDGKILKESMPLQPLIGNGHIHGSTDLIGVPGVWDDVYMFVSLPETDTVRLIISVQNLGYSNLYFDNFRVSLLKTGDKQ